MLFSNKETDFNFNLEIVHAGVAGSRNPESSATK